jgi:transcriptional regulator with XRE-family HTH domain
MAARNALLAAPPYAVERAIKTLGANIKTARIRRKLTRADIAEKIGVNPRVIGDAENGKPSTGIAIYVGLLWALDLLDHLSPVADPAKDAEGLALSLARAPSRARRAEVLDNDF